MDPRAGVDGVVRRNIFVPDGNQTSLVQPVADSYPSSELYQTTFYNVINFINSMLSQ
jgi:hypothetical protein